MLVALMTILLLLVIGFSRVYLGAYYFSDILAALIEGAALFALVIMAMADARAAEARVMAGAALGPLDGIPIAHKDLLETAGIRTTARRSPDGSEWILDGTKLFITNGVHADLYFVAAKTGGAGKVPTDAGR